jgi:hypothetical protein
LHYAKQFGDHTVTNPVRGSLEKKLYCFCISSL